MPVLLYFSFRIRFRKVIRSVQKKPFQFRSVPRLKMVWIAESILDLLKKTNNRILRPSLNCNTIQIKISCLLIHKNGLKQTQIKTH